VRGVGKKTAERIVVELKDKLKDQMIRLEPVAGDKEDSGEVARDALSALANLGYRPKEAEHAVRLALQQAKDASPTLENIIREALKLLV
jgi:Holliday junction DNA helicase RuvA